MSAILVREGRMKDFEHINELAATAIYPAFEHSTLTEEQRAENQRIVGITHDSCMQSLQEPNRIVLVAYCHTTLAGFVIADKAAQPHPEIDWLIVFPSFQGQGIADKLMAAALTWIGPHTDVMLGVIHYNTRAITFYKKCGFEDTGQIVGKHKIPRKLMIKKKRIDNVPSHDATSNRN